MAVNSSGVPFAEEPSSSEDPHAPASAAIAVSANKTRCFLMGSLLSPDRHPPPRPNITGRDPGRIGPGDPFFAAGVRSGPSASYPVSRRLKPDDHQRRSPTDGRETAAGPAPPRDGPHRRGREPRRPGRPDRPEDG